VNGSNVSRAALGFDSDQKASVEISPDEAGAARMNQITSSNVGSRFAVLADHKLIGAPVIRSPLSNTMQISLGLERDAAEALAEKIESSGPQK
jgi:preprotein translocase subunit SecD